MAKRMRTDRLKVIGVVAAAWLVVVAGGSSVMAQGSTRSYGEVTGQEVRVRAGAADFHAEILRLNRGDVVEIVGRSGDWTEVKLPGGFIAYANRGPANRRYIRKPPTASEGVVLVKDLQIRPKPTVDYPAMGELKQNQKVTVLTIVPGNAPGPWYRIFAPDDETVFIYNTYVRPGDAATLAGRFQAAARIRRASILKSAGLTETGTTHAQAKQAEQLDALDRRLDGNLKGSGANATKRSTELGAIRSGYEAVARGAGKDSPAARRAAARLKQIELHERALRQVDQASRKIDDIEARIRRSDEQYAVEMTRIREERMRRIEIEKKEKEAADSRYLRFGIGRIHPHVVERSPSFAATYTLQKGGKKRYFLISDRYDLQEYVGRTIGVTGWEFVKDAPERSLMTVEVKRLEIIE